MHNLFLNLVKHHCREILQIDLLGDVKDEESVVVATPGEMAAARTIWAKGVTSKNQLRKVKVPALLALCIENNIVLPRPNHGRQLQRSQIIDGLLSVSVITCHATHSILTCPTKASKTTSSESAEDDDMNPTGDEREPDNILEPSEVDPQEEPLQDRVDDDLHRDGAIGRKELRQIRKDIAATIRPGWQTGPPANFGASAHGKPKADQWRSCMEWDIPVSLIQMWATDPGASNDDRRQKLVESTIFLATALRWATSHRTSQRHVDEYMRNMRAYLQSLRDLFPEMKLRPNHHNALYLGELLLRFGPVHGWWMFPFERLIGLLQKINTNKKIGRPAEWPITRGYYSQNWSR